MGGLTCRWAPVLSFRFCARLKPHVCVVWLVYYFVSCCKRFASKQWVVRVDLATR